MRNISDYSRSQAAQQMPSSAAVQANEIHSASKTTRKKPIQSALGKIAKSLGGEKLGKALGFTKAPATSTHSVPSPNHIGFSPSNSPNPRANRPLRFSEHRAEDPLPLAANKTSNQMSLGEFRQTSQNLKEAQIPHPKEVYSTTVNRAASSEFDPTQLASASGNERSFSPEVQSRGKQSSVRFSDLDRGLSVSKRQSSHQVKLPPLQSESHQAPKELLTIQNAGAGQPSWKLTTDSGLDLPLAPDAPALNVSSREAPVGSDALSKEVGKLEKHGGEKRTKDRFSDFFKKALPIAWKQTYAIRKLFMRTPYFVSHDIQAEVERSDERYGKSTTVATQNSRAWGAFGGSITAAGAITGVAVGGPIGLVVGGIIGGGIGSIVAAYGFAVNEMGRVFGDSNAVMKKMDEVWHKRIDNLNQHYGMGLDEQFTRQLSREMSIKGVEYHMEKAFLGRGGGAFLRLPSSFVGFSAVMGGSAAVVGRSVTALAFDTSTAIIPPIGSRYAYMEAATALAVMESSMEGGPPLKELNEHINAKSMARSERIDAGLRNMLANHLKDHMFTTHGLNIPIESGSPMLDKHGAATHLSPEDYLRLHGPATVIERAITSRPQRTGNSSTSFAVKRQAFSNPKARQQHELVCLNKLQTVENFKASIEIGEGNHLRMFDVLQERMLDTYKLIDRPHSHTELEAPNKKKLVVQFAKAYETFSNSCQDEALKDMYAVRQFNRETYAIMKQFAGVKQIVTDDTDASRLTKWRRKLLPLSGDVKRAASIRGVDPLDLEDTRLLSALHHMLSEERVKSGEDFVWKPKEVSEMQTALNLSGLLSRPAGWLPSFLKPPQNSNAHADPLTLGDVAKWHTQEKVFRQQINKMDKRIQRVDVAESAKFALQSVQTVLRDKWGDDGDLGVAYRKAALSNARFKDKAESFERVSVKPRHKNGADRWKYGAHELLTSMDTALADETKPLSLKRLADIATDTSLLEQTRRFLATNDSSKVDAICDRASWKRKARSDNASKWDSIPSEMVSDVLIDMLQRRVNAKAEHYGRCLTPIACKKTRLTSQGIESTGITPEQRGIIFQVAQEGFAIDFTSRQLDEAQLSGVSAAQATLQTILRQDLIAHQKNVDPLRDALIEQQDQFTPATTPTVSYHQERKQFLKNVYKARQEAPLSPERVNVKIKRFVLAMANEDQLGMQHIAQMTLRPDFVEHAATMFGESNNHAWNRSMAGVRERQQHLHSASQKENAGQLHHDLGRIEDTGVQAAIEFRRAQDDIYAAAVARKNNRLEEGSSLKAQANEILAESVPELLLYMRSLTGYFAVEPAQANEQSKNGQAAEAFHDFYVQTLSGVENPQLSYTAPDFLDRVRQSEPSVMEALEWDVLDSASSTGSVGSTNTIGGMLTRAVAQAEQQRIHQGGAPRGFNTPGLTELYGYANAVSQGSQPAPSYTGDADTLAAEITSQLKAKYPQLKQHPSWQSERSSIAAYSKMSPQGHCKIAQTFMALSQKEPTALTNQEKNQLAVTATMMRHGTVSQNRAAKAVTEQPVHSPSQDQESVSISELPTADQQTAQRQHTLEERRELAWDALVRFARPTARGELQAKVNYDGNDFVKRASEAVLARENLVSLKDQAALTTPSVGAVNPGQFKRAAKGFLNIVDKGAGRFRKHNKAQQLCKLIQVADNVRREGALHPEISLLAPNTRETWVDRLFDEESSVSSPSPQPPPPPSEFGGPRSDVGNLPRHQGITSSNSHSREATQNRPITEPKPSKRVVFDDESQPAIIAELLKGKALPAELLDKEKEQLKQWRIDVDEQLPGGSKRFFNLLPDNSQVWLKEYLGSPQDVKSLASNGINDGSDDQSVSSKDTFYSANSISSNDNAHKPLVTGLPLTPSPLQPVAAQTAPSSKPSISREGFINKAKNNRSSFLAAEAKIPIQEKSDTSNARELRKQRLSKNKLTD
ncbi:MAG: hypothetical protein ACJAUP_000931 [Cellvibrionaceae bacterium]|jgi:hypothetical protein